MSQSLLSSLVLRPQCCVLDLRKAADFDSWHLPGSVNLPLQTLDSHTPKPFAHPKVLEAQWRELESVFTDLAVVGPLHEHHPHVLVICYNGDTARVATSVLRAKGIEADSLRGGYKALHDHGLWGETPSCSTGMINGASASANIAVPLQSN